MKEYRIEEKGIGIIEREKGNLIYISVKDYYSGVSAHLAVVEKDSKEPFKVIMKNKEGITKKVSYEEYLSLKDEGFEVVEITSGGVSISIDYINESIRTKVTEVLPVLDSKEQRQSEYKVVKDIFGEAYLVDGKGEIIEIEDHIISEIEPILYDGKFVIVKEQYGGRGVYNIQDRKFLINPEYDEIYPNMGDNKEVESFTAKNLYETLTRKTNVSELDVLLHRSGVKKMKNLSKTAHWEEWNVSP